MRIFIYRQNKKPFKIILPSSIFGSRLGAKFLANHITVKNDNLQTEAINSATREIDIKAMREFLSEIKKYRKKHGRFKLFEARSSDGEGLDIYI